ncbi:DUF885 domain-containing protein [Acidicapsa dinghuensis]|uniref:DUF885 domain-containing protein n=1 Tax=Acidicapsa dinghuensis TaxID=2218256 RepID=A0ABW1EC38_9BACT|nr:DUF885 domain-containing protein [Acidicapsa dinghuensis]
MSPRLRLVSAVLLSLSSLVAVAQKLQVDPNAANVPQSLEDRRKALIRLFDEVWQDNLRHSPEFASSIGDKRYNDQISDYSVKAFNENLAREQGYLMRLAAIDPTGFTDQEKISRDLLLRQFTDDQEAEQFKEWEFQINQMGGIHTTYPELVPQLSFETVKDYDDWIARLRAIPTAFQQATDDMELGVEDHRVPPKFLLEKALDQVKELANQKPEDSPLAQPLKKFPASISAADQTRIKQEMLDVIAKQVLPAYQKLARFMESTYVPAGRTDPGIWALPDGDKYYAFLVRRTTTTDLTPAQIHQIGLDEVAKDETDMLAIAKKLGFADLKSFEEHVKTDPKLKPASREALLDAYRGYLKPMQAKLPELFGRLPKAGFEVAPVPDYLEKTSADAYYEAGTPDGSRPGRIRVDTYNASDRNLCEVESIAYHEGLPGHHLQISIAQELTGVPEFRKYGGYTAFTEGWGLYAERLGKDVGFYTDPYSDYGRLEGDIWRAIRLVVDTGVHSQHWSRQQMVDYFHDHSAIGETSVQAEVDRYIAWPSQALAYKIGQLKILELRDKAQKALEPKFDIKAFHDEVLDSGALPLDVLDQRVTAWIAAQK